VASGSPLGCELLSSGVNPYLNNFLEGSPMPQPRIVFTEGSLSQKVCRVIESRYLCIALNGLLGRFNYDREFMVCIRSYCLIFF
jgi:hypothetical protein